MCQHLAHGLTFLTIFDFLVASLGYLVVQNCSVECEMSAQMWMLDIHVVLAMLLAINLYTHISKGGINRTWQKFFPPSKQQQELNDEIESLVSIANNTLVSKTTIQHQSGTNCAPSVTHFLHNSTDVKCQADSSWCGIANLQTTLPKITTQAVVRCMHRFHWRVMEVC